MFEIKIEWEEAPGVADPLLARTWARLELLLDGEPITRYWSERTRAVRDGVYGSVFPLAEWIASHWWVLLNEGPRYSASMTARVEAADHARAWLRRHNLLTCREGMAYPDLAIFRNDDAVLDLDASLEPASPREAERYDELDELAKEFRVSPYVIQHQVDNHRLA